VSQRIFQDFSQGHAFLRKLEQRMRVLHGASATTMDENAPGLDRLARRMGIRKTHEASEIALLLEKYRAVVQANRAAYLEVLGIES
jgi:glutamate-ammonia-ligase adenylyltransferase